MNGSSMNGNNNGINNEQKKEFEDMITNLER